MLNTNQTRPLDLNHQFPLFKKGDERAFRFFYELHHRPLYLFVRNLLRDDAVAEEITNDAFIVLGNNQHKINDPGHLEHFLYLVARRKTIDNLVKLKKRLQLEEAWAHYQYDWTTQYDDVEMVKDKILSLIFQHIKDLPPKQREVFILSFAKHMDVRSIAAQLKTSEKNVYKHLSKAYQYFATVFPRNELVIILLMTMWS